jgi:GTPase
MEDQKIHRSGFVNIIGKPNVGKSTLMNALVGERMSIITNKPQTTRHRILGIVSGDDYQMVFSDTPGIIKDPAYKMQEKMNTYVFTAIEDADIVLLVVDANDPANEELDALRKVSKLKVPKYLVINKLDTTTPNAAEEKAGFWREFYDYDKVFLISALNKTGTEELFASILAELPQGPEYYPKDQLTDRPERFFVAEIIREKILEQYYHEIPYSVEIIVESFKEDPEKPLVRINVLIYVEKESQKNILIGPKGSAIKNVGIAARKDLEIFLEKQVHLETHIKVRDNWRDDEKLLNKFGYGL